MITPEKGVMTSEKVVMTPEKGVMTPEKNMITPEKIIALIKGGKQINVDFYPVKTAIHKDIYATISAFNNYIGGHIILGVNARQEIIGVNPAIVEKLISDFIQYLRNQVNMYPIMYLPVQVLEVDHKTLLYIYVPEGKDLCRHNGRIYDRTAQGNTDITDNMDSMFEILERKVGKSILDKVYPYWSVDMLDAKTIDKARRLAGYRNPEHPWLSMGDEELLRSLDLIQTDPETQREAITLAAILLFGTEQLIASALAHHRTDAIVRVVDLHRYDDRDVVTVNLIESYERLINFGKKHLNDPFVLDGILRVNARDFVLREIVSNTLIHRNYAARVTPRMVITADAITIENGNRTKRLGKLDQDTKPFDKNPVIAKVFREIGFADEPGSGLKNLYKYTILYSQAEPVLEEDREIFTTVIPLARIATLKVGGNIQ